MNNSKIKPIKIIEASGSYYEIGFTVGQQTKEEIHQLLATTGRATADDLESIQRYSDFLPFVLKYPNIKDELQGMADGSGLDFETLVKLNIVELNKTPSVDLQCSTFYITNSSQHAIGHNEDGRDEDDIFLLKADYPSGTQILSICYFARLPGFATNINSNGLVMTCNALTSNDKKIGIPKVILARLMIECHSIDEVLNVLKNNDRAQGQHFLIISEEKIVGIEVSASNFQVQEIHSNYYHCNNYLYPEMLEFEAGDVGCKGYLRTKSGKCVYKSLQTIDDIKETLSSHDNQPFSFCSHGSSSEGGLLTLGTLIINLKSKEISIGYGATCKADWIKVNFRF